MCALYEKDLLYTSTYKSTFGFIGVVAVVPNEKINQYQIFQITFETFITHKLLIHHILV